MSVESEILRIQQNIANAYAAVSEKGGEVPLRPNSANLAAAVGSISVGETSAHIISGSYVGTGTSNFEINIGFRPKIVLISQYSIYSIGLEMGIFIDDCRGLKLVLSNAALTTAVIPVGWTDSGLVIGDATSGVHLNYPEAPYHYVAIK